MHRRFNNDTQYGDTVGPDGHRAQAFAIGPQVIYYTTFGGLALKWRHDFAVRNRAAGDSVWIQFALPIFGTATHMNAGG